MHLPPSAASGLQGSGSGEFIATVLLPFLCNLLRPPFASHLLPFAPTLFTFHRLRGEMIEECCLHFFMKNVYFNSTTGNGWLRCMYMLVICTKTKLRKKLSQFFIFLISTWNLLGIPIRRLCKKSSKIFSALFDDENCFGSIFLR